MGTTQGSIISPILGNIYMHHVLDKWFHEEVLKRLQGRARLVRHAGDLVIGFSRQEDAVRVLEVLRKRMARFGLSLHPDNAGKAIGEWCRSHRHDPVQNQHAALNRRLLGHYNDFGVNGNTSALNRLRHEVERLWRKWLNRRSQQRSLTWEKFGAILKRFPLPAPGVNVQVWGHR